MMMGRKFGLSFVCAVEVRRTAHAVM